MSLQHLAPEEFQRQIFQELEELEEQKTKEALELLGRKHKSGKLEKEQESSKDATRHGAGFFRAVDSSPFGSCSPSQAQDADDAVSASSRGHPWNAAVE